MYIQERIRQDGAKSWRVSVRLKGYPRQEKTFRKLKDAKAWGAETESKMNRGGYIPESNSTFADLVEHYKLHNLPLLRDQKTRLHHIEHWRKELGKYAVKNITPSIVVKMRAELLTGTRTPTTVNRYVAALSHMFTTAIELEWIPTNPCSKIKKLPEPRGRTRFLSDTEREELLKQCQVNDSLYLTVVLALSTGARRSEIWKLQWEQIDFKRERMTFYETKNGEIRTVPVQGEALRLLQERHEKSTNKFVFPSPRYPKQPYDMTAPFYTALENAKIKNFRWHDLRHSAASYLAMSGATLAEIAEILGHKTLQMVKRYSHLTETHTKGVVKRMNSQFIHGQTAGNS